MTQDTNKYPVAVEQPTGDLPPLPGSRNFVHGYGASDMQDYARAAITTHLARQSQPSTLGCAVPAGFAVVPLVPTREMQDAYFKVIDKNMQRVTTDPLFGRWDNMRAAYTAMLVATPQAPAAQKVPPASEVQADEAKMYRDLTGDAMALGFDGIPAALEALRAAGVAQEVTQQAAKASDPVAIVREAVRQLAESPRRAGSSYVEGMVVGANMCLVRLERVFGVAPTTSTVSVPGVQEPCAKLINHDGNGTATIMLTPGANVRVGTSLYLASPTSPDSSGQAGAQAVRSWDYMRANHAGAIADALGCMTSDIESQIALRTSGTGSAA